MAKENQNQNAQQSNTITGYLRIDLSKISETPISTKLFCRADEAKDDDVEHLIAEAYETFEFTKTKYVPKDENGNPLPPRTMVGNVVDAIKYRGAYKAVKAGIIEPKDVPSIRFANLFIHRYVGQVFAKNLFAPCITFARFHGQTYLIGTESESMNNFEKYPEVQTKFFAEDDGLMNEKLARLVGNTEIVKTATGSEHKVGIRIPTDDFYVLLFGMVISDNLGGRNPIGGGIRREYFSPCREIVEDIRKFILVCGEDGADKDKVLESIDALLATSLNEETELESATNGWKSPRTTTSATELTAEAKNLANTIAKYANFKRSF